MPRFDTPEPISVTLNAVIADVRVRAGERADTVVEVAPSDPADAEDRRAADGTRVEFAGGTLSVVAPKTWARFAPGRTGGALDITIDLPAGSEIRASASILALHGEGRLGPCSVKTSVGGVTLEECGPLQVSAPERIDVGRVAGPANVSGIGDIRLGVVEGTVTVESVNGHTRIDSAAGAVRCRSANGGITIGSAGDDVDVKTANGDLYVDEVTRGSISLETSSGRVGIGIRPGTAALLDVRSSFGRVVTDVAQADGPQETDEVATVRARTSYGDVVVGRPQNV